MQTTSLDADQRLVRVCMSPQRHGRIQHHCMCRATRDPAAPEAINQYDPIFAAPTGNFTPWQIHISPADATFQHMFVVYATGKYLTGLNENGGLCETVTFQQSCKLALSFIHTSCVHLLVRGCLQVLDLIAKCGLAYLKRTSTSLVLLHTAYVCAFKPGCLMSHNWLHTSDCNVCKINEMNY